MQDMPPYKGHQSAPTVQSFSLRYSVGRLRTVPEIAVHLKAGRKLAIRWRERLRLDASDSISCRESRPVFVELLACVLLRVETALQVNGSVLRRSGLGCAAAARGYIPIRDTIAHGIARTKPDANGNGCNGSH